MNIVLKSLDLVHFKCFPKLHLDFHEGVNNIYGENAAGKTSVYDALTWLLFNKDSAGNARPDIKPNGAPARNRKAESGGKNYSIHIDTGKFTVYNKINLVQ